MNKVKGVSLIVLGVSLFIAVNTLPVGMYISTPASLLSGVSIGHGVITLYAWRA